MGDPDRLDARLWLELGWSEYFRVEPVPALYAILRAVNVAEGLGPCYERIVGQEALARGALAEARRWGELALAAGAPALRLAEVTGLGLLALCEADLPTWGPPARRFFDAMQVRTRRIPLHQPLVDRLDGQLCWLEDRQAEARRRWAEGKVLAERYGMKGERARLERATTGS